MEKVDPIPELRKCLHDMGDDFVFIVGNGINKFLSAAPSWNELLTMVAEKEGIELPDPIKEALSKSESDAGLNFPEIYSLLDADLLSLKRDPPNGKAGSSLKKSIAEHLRSGKVNCKLLDYAQRTRRNIITLNFDYRIEDHLKIKHAKKKSSLQEDCPVLAQSIYHYLFESFGGPATATVWHLHGHCNKPGSIRLGLEDYTNTLTYIKKKLLCSESRGICDPHSRAWSGQPSCLQIFFTKPLVIVGCGLQSEEVLLRGLMLAKYRKQRDNCRIPGVYLTKQSENDRRHQDKFAFLESLGYRIVEFSSYRDIYNCSAWE